jgi:hypothetical protein
MLLRLLALAFRGYPFFSGFYVKNGSEVKMSGLWRVSASLEHVGDARRIHYKVDKVSEYAYPALGTILFWCKGACEELLSDLEKKQADKKDLEYIKREIEFLDEVQADWEKRHKKRVE